MYKLTKNKEFLKASKLDFKCINFNKFSIIQETTAKLSDFKNPETCQNSKALSCISYDFTSR